MRNEVRDASKEKRLFLPFCFISCSRVLSLRSSPPAVVDPVTTVPCTSVAFVRTFDREKQEKEQKTQHQLEPREAGDQA